MATKYRMIKFWDWLTEAAYRNARNCPYWGDAGSGVLPFCQATGRFLANHRGQGVNEGGTFGIFGGGIFLGRTSFASTQELAASDYPKKHALEELAEETGYRGPIQLEEIYVYKDAKTSPSGEPCDFFYWNYVGICPEEFPVRPGAQHAWEEGGESGWLTFEELMNVQPKHFGLQALLQNAGSKLANLSRQYAKHESTLPQMADNYLKPLSTYTDTLYHETNVHDLPFFLPNSNSRQDMKFVEIYFANTPALALGQGRNRGVLLEFDAAGLQGKVNTSKPGWEFSYKQGKVELVGKHNDQAAYQEALRKITVSQGKPPRILEQLDWGKQGNTYIKL